MRRSRQFSFVFAVMCFASSAVAQEAPASTEAGGPEQPAELDCSEYVAPEIRGDAEQLAIRGVTCFEAGEYLTALRHYRRASELSKANLFNAAIGRTFQELGYPFIARRYYKDYLAGKVEERGGRQKIGERLKAVEKELEDSGSTVTLESFPPGAEVQVVVDETHWEPLGSTPLEVQLTPGKYTFIVEKDGYVNHTQSVSVSGPGKRTVDADLVAEDATFPVADRSLRRAGVYTMAAGIPLVAGGTALFLVGTNKRGAGEDLRGSDRDEQIKAGATLQQVGLAVGVVGVAAVGTGLALFLVSGANESGDEGPDAEARWRPIIAPNYIGARLTF